MSLWDSRFLDRVRKLGIKLEIYKRYVDDNLIVCPPIIPVWSYDKKSNIMIYSKDLADKDTDEPDMRTAKILNQVANKLEPNIQMTFDVPSFHTDKKMPFFSQGLGRGQQGYVHFL